MAGLDGAPDGPDLQHQPADPDLPQDQQQQNGAAAANDNGQQDEMGSKMDNRFYRSYNLSKVGPKLMNYF